MSTSATMMPPMTRANTPATLAMRLSLLGGGGDGGDRLAAGRPQIEQCCHDDPPADERCGTGERGRFGQEAEAPVDDDCADVERGHWQVRYARSRIGLPDLAVGDHDHLG